MTTGRTPAQYTDREKEMARLLTHCVDCLNAECEICPEIQQQLDDGPQHFPPDPMRRAYLVRKALTELEKQAHHITDYLESAPIPKSVLTAVIELHENIKRTQQVFREPVARCLPKRTPVKWPPTSTG